jgi:hypothetical protein
MGGGKSLVGHVLPFSFFLPLSVVYSWKGRCLVKLESWFPLKAKLLRTRGGYGVQRNNLEGFRSRLHVRLIVGWLNWRRKWRSLCVDYFLWNEILWKQLEGTAFNWNIFPFFSNRQISGAMIRISNCEDRESSSERTITITGTAESVALAQYLINTRSVHLIYFLSLIVWYDFTESFSTNLFFTASLSYLTLDIQGSS